MAKIINLVRRRASILGEERSRLSHMWVDVDPTRVRAGVLALVLGSGCFGAPGYHGPVSPHFDGSRFHNVPPAEPPGITGLLAWQWNPDDIPWPEGPFGKATRPEPLERGIRVTAINHATTLVQIDGVSVLTDPVWSERVGPLAFVGPSRWAEPGIAWEDLPRIDGVVISHNHYDHCDAPTLARLAGRFAMPIFAGLGSKEMLADLDVDGGVDLDWWQTVPIARGVTVTMVPTQHWSRRGVLDRDTVLWGGYVLKGPSGSVYFAGDTGFGPHFAAIRERVGPPTIAILPISAYEPRWFMHTSHMGPDEAVDAHRALGARRSVGIHWGTFDLSDEGRWQPAGELGLALDAARIPRRDFVALVNGAHVEP
jgi:L-ascorbate metabolism protein UlaG (beta-lactamase superfamily)